MNTNFLKLLLADDDEDDCFFFKEAVQGLPVATMLTVVHDGEQLMELLHNKASDLPDFLFLDLNMPRKGGHECLMEIRLSPTLRRLPVIILSTYINPDTEEKLYKSGATHCIVKPPHIAQLKDVIQRELALTVEAVSLPPAKDALPVEVVPTPKST
ncbi:response regulator [uncultured Fibrella sp.]|uniref:response regulator n=1 Tax=uncultured Fibrella sp. TaxID=1284596 RepID=UPI0035CC07E9